MEETTVVVKPPPAKKRKVNPTNTTKPKEQSTGSLITTTTTTTSSTTTQATNTTTTSSSSTTNTSAPKKPAVAPRKRSRPTSATQKPSSSSGTSSSSTTTTDVASDVRTQTSDQLIKSVCPDFEDQKNWLVQPERPKTVLYSTFIIDEETVSNISVLIESKSPDQNTSVAKYIHDGFQVWEEFLEGKVSMVRINKRVIAIAVCKPEPTLFFFSHSGSRVIPPMVMDSPVGFMEIDEKDNLLVITAFAEVFVWNVQHMKTIIKTSLAPLLDDNPPFSIDHAEIKENGMPLVVRSDQQTFLYHKGLKSWTLVGENESQATQQKKLPPPPLFDEPSIIALKEKSMSFSSALIA